MKDLLKLIEAVDPSDTAKLDEIDARVACMLCFSGSEFVAVSDSRNFYSYRMGAAHISVAMATVPKYTRSRDALKAIRPEGLYFFARQNPSGRFYGDDANGDYPSPALPTEELAELHAIIQAIDYERTTAKA